MPIFLFSRLGSFGAAFLKGVSHNGDRHSAGSTICAKLSHRFKVSSPKAALEMFIPTLRLSAEFHSAMNPLSSETQHDGRQWTRSRVRRPSSPMSAPVQIFRTCLAGIACCRIARPTGLPRWAQLTRLHVWRSDGPEDFGRRSPFELEPVTPGRRSSLPPVNMQLRWRSHIR